MECTVCGGKEYQTNVGKQICMECGTENTQYVDVALDDNEMVLSMKASSHRLLSITDKVQAEKDKIQRCKDKKLEASSSWTTYEALTLVLQEWTSILVQLGASSSLPKLVLKLWAGYLSKIEVAFLPCQSHLPNRIKRPKLGFVENKRDTQLLYQEREYVSHAEISARTKRYKVTSEKENQSLKRIMNRVERRYLKARITGRASRAASVASDLSAYLLAAEERQVDDDASSTSNRGLEEDDGSSGVSSAMSCSSRGSSSVGRGADAKDDEPPKRQMIRSHYVLRWLRNKKNMYLRDKEKDLDFVHNNLDYGHCERDRLAGALRLGDSSGSDADYVGNGNKGGGRTSNHEEENPTTSNVEGGNVTSAGYSFMNSDISPKSTQSALFNNDVLSTPCLMSLGHETDPSYHNNIEDEQIMNKQKSSPHLSQKYSIESVSRSNAKLRTQPNGGIQHLSQKYSRSFESVSRSNAKLKTQTNVGVNTSALNNLNQSPEILREMGSDDSGESVDGSVAANISSLKNEDDLSDANDPYEDIHFTKIVNEWSSKSFSKLQQNAGASNRQPSLNRVEEDKINIMSEEKTNCLQSALTDSEDSFPSDPCDDSVKDPDFEPVSPSSKGTVTENGSCLEDDLSDLDQCISQTSRSKSAHFREIEKLNKKCKQNNEQCEEEGNSKRQTLGSRSDLPKRKCHRLRSFKSAKGIVNAAESSQAQGYCLPEQIATNPFNDDELDRFLQRKEQSPRRKRPKGKKRFGRRGYKYAKIWFRLNEPMMPTFPKLLALLYIACRINREEILLLDLLRWCSSNHLPFTTAPYILPDSIVTLSRYDLDLLAQCKNVPSHYRIRRHIARLSLLMEVQSLPLPCLETVSSRLLHGLCLPEDLQESVVAFASKQRSLFPPTRLEYPGVELLVGAVIIFLLKASWGLDGVQEQQLSAEVLRVNDELERLGSSHRLFCWKTWHRHLMRVQWFNKTIDPGLVTKVEDSTPFAKHYQAERLAQYFWTHGIWRRPRTSVNGDDKQAAMLDRLLRAQHLTLPDAVGEARIFQASYLPFTGYAEQYLHCWRADRGQDKEEMKQLAESIKSTSFESHQSGFLRDAASDVRRELLSVQSRLTVSVRYGDVFALPWTLFNMHKKNRHLNGTAAIDDSDSDMEGGGEAMNSFPRQSTIDESNFESRLQEQILSRKQSTTSQFDELEQSQQSSVNKSQTAAPALEELILSNPMERMWLLSSFPRTRKGGVLAKHLPPSYRWLVRLMAELCCTTEKDVIWHAFRLEKAVTGVDRRVDVFV